MATRKVKVERYVEQVVDGSRYKGYVIIATTKLDYELVFGVPIATMRQQEPTKDESEIRRLFQLKVKRGSENIELTKNEYAFFLSMIVDFVAAFYDNAQTRNSQEGAMGLLLSGRGPMANIGASLSIGMTSIGSYGFSPEVCETLSDPKFGCTLGD